MTSLEIDSTPLHIHFLQGIEKMSPTLDDMISYWAFCLPPTFTQPKTTSNRAPRYQFVSIN